MVLSFLDAYDFSGKGLGILEEYGGFEKVGPLGLTLPRSDEPISGVPGDITVTFSLGQ